MKQLAEILDELDRFVRRYVVVSTVQAVAFVLWIAHTYVIDAFGVTPYLAFTSPGRRTGKTRALEVARVLVHNPIMTASISPSALFRVINAGSVTVLFDEVDTVFGRRDGNEDLRALLNAGFSDGGVVYRSEAEGRKFVQRAFNVFAPKALAGIGTFPDTVADRCIHCRMKRRTTDEPVERFRRRVVEIEAVPIREALEAWAASGVIERLREAWPVIPDDLDDRAADAWEPLLAIADEAAHGWDCRARHAALELAKDRGSDEESAGTLLLAHVRDAFGDRAHVTTAELLEELVSREDGPWGRWWGDAVEGGRLKGPASRLARELKPFGIVPKVLRVGTSTQRGYEREMFTDAWSRYLSSVSVPPEQTQHETRNPETAADLDVALLRPAGETPDVTSNGHVRSGCVRCERYGPDHTGGHIGAWSEVKTP